MRRWIYRNHQVNCPTCGWVSVTKLHVTTESLRGGVRRIKCCVDCGRPLLRVDSHPRRRIRQAVSRRPTL